MADVASVRETARAALRDGRPRRRERLTDAALLGGAGGLRSTAPFAALAARGRAGKGLGRGVLIASAAGEAVADKLPITPPRTSPPSLAGRLAGSALAGGRIGGPAGAAAAGAAAGLSAFAGERARGALGRRTGLPDPLLGATEDLIAAGAALVATRRLDGALRSRPRRSPLGALWRGLAAGVAGTAVMTAVQTIYYKATGSEGSETPAEVGERIVGGVLRREVPGERRPLLNQVMHWSYGSSWGIPLGLVAGSRATPPPVAATGALAGLSVWGASLVVLPALKLAPPVWRYPPKQLASDVGFHLAWGFGAAGALRALRG